MNLWRLKVRVYVKSVKLVTSFCATVRCLASVLLVESLGRKAIILRLVSQKNSNLFFANFVMDLFIFVML